MIYSTREPVDHTDLSDDGYVYMRRYDPPYHNEQYRLYENNLGDCIVVHSVRGGLDLRVVEFFAREHRERAYSYLKKLGYKESAPKPR